MRGKVRARPSRTLTFFGRIFQPRRTCSVPWTATGRTAAPVSSARRPKPRFGLASDPVRCRVPSGKMQIAPPRSSTSREVTRVCSSDWPAADRVGAEPVEDPALPALLEELDLGDVVERAPPGKRGADHERVEEAAVVGRDDQRALDLAVLAPDAREPEVEEEERDEDQAREEVERAVDAVLAREAVVAEQPLLVHRPDRNPAQRAVTGGSTPARRATRRLRGSRPGPRGSTSPGSHVRELGPRHRHVDHLVDPVLDPLPARPSGDGRRARRFAPAARGVRTQGGRERLDLLRRPLPHRLHRVRQQRGVGLRVRSPEHPDRGLAEDVMEGDPGAVDGDRAEQGTEGKSGAVALVRAAGRARARSAPPRAARPPRESASASGV